MTMNSQARTNGLKGLDAVNAFMRAAKWKAEVVEQADDYHAYRVSFEDDVPVVGCLLEVYMQHARYMVRYEVWCDMEAEKATGVELVTIKRMQRFRDLLCEGAEREAAVAEALRAFPNSYSRSSSGSALTRRGPLGRGAV